MGEAEDRTPGERRERKDMRRNLALVLQAAHELFAERGTTVTMEEVARRAGVGMGTIYRRFPSKDHLFAAVSQAACASAQQHLHEAVQQDANPLHKLRSLVRAFYRYAELQATLIDLRPAAAPATECCTPESQELYSTFHRLLQQIIAEGQEQGIIRQGNTMVLAALCLELLNPRSYQNLRYAIGGSADTIAECTVQFMLYGLGAQQPGDQQ